MDDENAWKEFSDKRILLQAFSAYRCDMTDSDSSTGTLTPPGTPANEQQIDEHNEESQTLRSAINDFKAHLAQKDHFESLPGYEVAGNFLRLTNDIENFSRIEWAFLKEPDWSFFEEQLRQFYPRDTRMLKQWIVQNTIWVILYGRVFRSPFRVFGAVGKEFDPDWIGLYEPDVPPSKWPIVPAELERSRYQIAKIFLDAMESSQSRLKDGYEKSVVSAVNAICRPLQKVATVDAMNLRLLDNILRRAAKIWLEICSQKYRLVVVLLRGSGDVLTSVESDTNSLRLIVRPHLLRYGDSQGNDMTRGGDVAGWRGLVESYPSE